MHDPPNLNRFSKLGIATAPVATSSDTGAAKTAGLCNFKKDLLL